MDKTKFYVIVFIVGLGIITVGFLGLLAISAASPEVLLTAHGGCFLNFGTGCNTTVYQSYTLQNDPEIFTSSLWRGGLLVLLGILLAMLYFATRKQDGMR